MSTEAQITANRENAQYSTGPRSEEGKARSSKNNLRWGFVGAFCVLSYESQAEFDSLHSSLRGEHNPATPTEDILVEKMAQHLWLTRRALRLQDMTLTDSGLSLDQQNHQLSLFLRYHTTHDRGFHKSLNELLKLRAEKRKVDIGFERQKREEQKLNRERERAQRAEAIEARKQAAEQRKQDRNKFDVMLAQAKAEHQGLINMTLGHDHPHLRPLSSAAMNRAIAAAHPEAA